MASTRVSVYRDGGGGDVLCSKIYHALQKKKLDTAWDMKPPSTMGPDLFILVFRRRLSCCIRRQQAACFRFLFLGEIQFRRRIVLCRWPQTKFILLFGDKRVEFKLTIFNCQAIFKSEVYKT